MDENTYSVYQHIFPDGMIYTGLTHLVPVEKRFGKDGKRYNRNKTLWNYICKYGWDNVEHIVIQNNLSKEEAQQLERKLIAETKANGNCINTFKGGDLGGESYIMFDYKGERLSATEIYDKYPHGNVTKQQFKSRVLFYNWDIDRALEQSNDTKLQPFGIGERIYEYDGKMLNSYELWHYRKIDELPQSVIVERINQYHWDIDRALSQPLKKQDVIYEYRGNSYNTTELAALYPENNLENHDITDRLRRGWSVEKAVETPKAHVPTYEFNGKQMTLSAIYKTFPEPKVAYTTFFSKVKKGLSFEEAVKRVS